MPIITVKGSFQQAYYYEQECITQAATLIASCAPNCPSYDAERPLVEETTKAVAVLNRPSDVEVADTPGGSGSLAGPSI